MGNACEAEKYVAGSAGQEYETRYNEKPPYTEAATGVSYNDDYSLEAPEEGLEPPTG